MSVNAEVQLTAEPFRVDDLIELRAGATRDPTDTGGTLHGMWQYITIVGLLEFKSISRPFRRGDLYRLLAYGLTWLFARQSASSSNVRLSPRDLCLILAVPSITPTLNAELASLELALPPSEDGYHAVTYGNIRLLVVDLSLVAEREDDDILRIFTGRPPQTLAARGWMIHYVRGEQAMSTKVDSSLPGYDDMMALLLREVAQSEPKLFHRILRLSEIPSAELLADVPPEQRLAGLPPEQRLAGLPPEQRLAGLSEAEQVLAFSDNVLRALSPSYIESLPADIQQKIKARLQR